MTFLSSLAHGAAHPLLGLDHVLAMLAVGVWAALIGGRALWSVPSGFVAAMVAGFIMARAGLSLPALEPVIAASGLVLGLAAALAWRAPGPVAVALAAFFGLFHGAAHGGELGEATAAGFAMGFFVVTAALHAGGAVLAIFAARTHPLAPRIIGVASVALGLSLLI